MSEAQASLTQELLSFSLGGAEWVLYLLLALSLVSGGILVERLLVLSASRSDLDLLQAMLADLLSGADLAQVRAALAEQRGIEASVIRQGLERAEAGPAVVEEIMTSLMGLERLKLERRVAFLGTVGSNAPLIGLFGTVLGVIRAFHELGDNPAGGAPVIMAGISEALVATAVGLLVAIPAVVTYNVLQRRIKRRMGHLQSLAHLALAACHVMGGPRGLRPEDVRAQRGPSWPVSSPGER